jgi:transketolase N-terminal domain/subunit
MTEQAPIGTDGIVIATQTLMVTLLSRLKAKGILTDEDLSLIIDEPRLGLEQMGLTDPSVRAAHGVLGQILDVALGKPQPTNDEQG